MGAEKAFERWRPNSASFLRSQPAAVIATRYNVAAVSSMILRNGV